MGTKFDGDIHEPLQPARPARCRPPYRPWPRRQEAQASARTSVASPSLLVLRVSDPQPPQLRPAQVAAPVVPASRTTTSMTISLVFTRQVRSNPRPFGTKLRLAPSLPSLCPNAIAPNPCVLRGTLKECATNNAPAFMTMLHTRLRNTHPWLLGVATMVTPPDRAAGAV